MADEKKKVTIVVDGTPTEVDHDEVTYKEIVEIADPASKQHPEYTYSVTYDNGPPKNPSGILAPGGKVHIKNEMEFRVSRSGQS